MKISLSVFCLLFSMLIATAQSNNSKLANEYFQQGDFEKAKDLFEKLAKKKNEIPLIQANYLDLLVQERNYEQAEKFLLTVIKHYPANYQYQTSLLKLFHVSDQKDKKEKYLQKLDKQVGNDQFQINTLAKNLANQELLDDAIYYYKKSRKISKNPWAFALDLAAIYRVKGDMENMTYEYLNYAESNPRNLSYVKNLFQNLLTAEEDQDYLEKTLIDKIQRNPQDVLYAELLIWLELQRKNFYAAFIQARALDKRTGKPGDQSMRIGRIALDNKSWEESIEIFQYVLDKYPNGRNFVSAKKLYIESRESKVKNTFPVDKEEIRRLSKDYNKLYEQMGPNPSTLQALRSKALLHAFYLNEKDSAILILNEIITNRRSPKNLTSDCKLDLGDIHLLINEPWESTLLYSQVEKANKESLLGYKAKLKNAKLNYFTGNFALAKDHLDILKLATTREISNDAIALGVLIQGNTVFDSTDLVMQRYANIELLIFQNESKRAENELHAMLKEYPGHSLTDEIYWTLSQVHLEKAEYLESISFLDKIIEGYQYDILSDDAFYRKGVILSDYLKDDDSALEVFVSFLKAHPGSMYTAEARTRIRKLRGDYIN
ncbi:MAG: tetratricopeptide repeat protein [Cyclobacteriaceae bacterium]